MRVRTLTGLCRFGGKRFKSILGAVSQLSLLSLLVSPPDFRHCSLAVGEDGLTHGPGTKLTLVGDEGVSGETEDIPFALPSHRTGEPLASSFRQFAGHRNMRTNATAVAIFRARESVVVCKQSYSQPAKAHGCVR